MQDTNYVIEMSPKEKEYEFLRSAKSRPKRENYDVGIDRLRMYFDAKT